MEFAFEPYKKITFKSMVQYETPEKLAANIALAVHPSATAHSQLRWASGVVFSIIGFAQTDSLMKEFIAGNLIWDHIDFAMMPKYKEEVKLPNRPLVTFSVVNLSGHPVFEPLCDWLRKEFGKKP